LRDIKVNHIGKYGIKMVVFYDNSTQMEPFFIDSTRPAHNKLLGQAHELSEASARFDALLATDFYRIFIPLVMSI
jgi:hypothetical protein